MDKAFSEITEHLRSGRTALFCGAGISYNSGVPLVYDIKSSILSRLELTEADQKKILDFQMPFELFMETVLTHSGEHGLFNLFEIGQPNTNHFFIAELCRLGLVSFVVTTNFDNHLETALEKTGVAYRLLYREEDFGEFTGEPGVIQLLKLHGSVHDRDNIAITIKKVAGKQLIAYRKKVIDDLMHSEGIDNLLFLGYSFSDIFDIVPNIQKALRDGLSIHNIDHQLDYDHVPEVLAAGAIKDGQVFRPMVSGSNIKVNTDRFIRGLWLELVDRPYHFMERVPVVYEHLIDTWYSGCKAANPLVNDYLPGQLFNTMAMNAMALDYFQRGLTSLRGSSGVEIDRQINFLYAIG